jgi:uncharacterized membrane protein YvlD (DUF360 family)
MNPNDWTEADLRRVTFVTLGNAIWLGALLWLVLDLWLGVAGFWACILAAVLISWVRAIWWQGRVIARRGGLTAD